jgi:hypothetical protein
MAANSGLAGKIVFIIVWVLLIVFVPLAGAALSMMAMNGHMTGKETFLLCVYLVLTAASLWRISRASDQGLAWQVVWALFTVFVPLVGAVLSMAFCKMPPVQDASERVRDRFYWLEWFK